MSASAAAGGQKKARGVPLRVTVASTSDHFGIVAANIGYMKIGATVEPLTPGLDVIELLPLTTNDVTIREL